MRFVGNEMTLGLGATLFALSMAMGCGVERDLSLAQFSCVQGGPCDAGMAVDSGLPDSGLPDSGRMDSGLPDSGLPDSGLPDSGLPDSGLPDSGLPDSGLPDSGPADAGMVDLEFCPGTYEGFTTGTDPGSIIATLFDDGTLVLTLFSARHTSGQLVRLKVQSDRTLALLSGADELTGFFDTERCVASGSWMLNGFGGPWEISEE